MKLSIDTSEREKITIGLGGKEFTSKAREDTSQKLLPFIVEVLSKEGKKMEDIREISVDTGPGSFTGLRVGVAVAITLGWALDIPVNGKSVKKGEIPEIKYE